MQTTTTTVGMFSIMLSALLALTLLSPLAAAHSWVEEYQIISDNGSFTGPRGYLRGYVSRTDPTYNGFSMMWMLPSLEARNTDGTVRTRIDDTDLVCHPAQRTSNYTAAYPKLKVSPGDYVAMKYLENGHVSLPWNITGKPPGGGTVFIFGTTKASDDEKIADVMQWTRDGKGGNGNGFLMTAQNYDDGRCHQINCGSISQSRQILQPNHVAGQPTSTVESWCENDLLIPESVSPGTLTTYWIWQFGTEPNTDCNTPAGKDEYYTSCADFDVVDKAELSKQLAAAPSSAPVGESNPQTAAVSDYKSRTAYTTAPSYVLMSNNKIAGPGSIAPVNSAFVSSCSAQASIISANNLGVWPEVYVPNTCSVISSFGTEAAQAWSKTWDVEASSYTAGASSAWGAAFKAAGLEVPGRVPTWSVVPTASAGATASGYGGAEPASSSSSSQTAIITSTSAAAAPAATTPAPASAPSGYSSGNAAGAMTTIITVVTLTSTLPVSQISSVSVSVSSSLASASPSAYSPSSSSSSSPSPASSSSSSGPGLSIPTISTVSVSASSPPATAASSAPGYAPTVAANGTVNYLRHRRGERAHARNFFFGR
ncbi:hypothetical protein Slin14017_G021600 [Septoria linicola]|nr:hypothetical protein Slin14017_G021600 [Septoria linicola]